MGLTTWTELYDQFRRIQSDNGTPNAYPGTALRQGSSGQNVRLVQFWLKIARTVYSSLSNVTVDGIFGSSTAAAVRRFQTYFGLTSDGVVGRTTWNKLYEVYNDIANRLLSPSLRPGEYPGVLRNGSTGTAVRELQFYLYLMSAYQSSIPLSPLMAVSARPPGRRAGLPAVRRADGGRHRRPEDMGFALRQSVGPPLVRAGGHPQAPPLPRHTAHRRHRQQRRALLHPAFAAHRLLLRQCSVPALSSQYTQETADATASAQELLGLPATGVADAETWTSVEALSLQLAAFTPNPDRHPEQGSDYPDRAMKEGSAGPDVSLIEGWLNDHSQLYCEEDYVADNAVFGPEDTAAVKETQQRAGLETNGVVDRPTWAALRAQSHTACDNCTEEGEMARLLVYDAYENKVYTYSSLRENDPMPYSTGRTLTVREFRGKSNSPVLWTTIAAMEAWNLTRRKYGRGIPVGYAFRRIWEGGHGTRSQHYAGVAFDVGQSLSQTQRTAIYNAARSTGAWGYVEPLSQTPHGSTSTGATARLPAEAPRQATPPSAGAAGAATS